MWKSLTYSLFAVFMLITTASAQLGGRLGEDELVKIYPNPVVSEATISVSRDLDLEKHRVSITFYNVVGKEVYKVSNVKEFEVRISREPFLPGMYIYQLKIDDRTQSTGRITVK